MANEIARPMPPPEVFDSIDDIYLPAPELEAWIRFAFIEGTSGGEPIPSVNPEHGHLCFANIGCLWTNAENRKTGKRVGATAEIPNTQGDAWKRGRFDQQLSEWFGQVPDFILTFDASIAARLNDVSFCALCEHELYHCGQKLDKWGFPAFSKATGLPKFAMRAHDVEEFTMVAARYGVEACAGDSIAFVEAANSKPLFGRAQLDCCCGACGR